MDDWLAARPVTVSIAAVERDTGLSKDTLRVWERRYGFPTPLRDASGERAYSLEQLDKLRVIKRLMDNGHRPGRIAALRIEELHRLGETLPLAPQKKPAHDNTDLSDYLALIKSHDVNGLRHMLGQALMRMGVSHFICDVIAPLNTAVGDAWMRGQMEVFEEHLYTEAASIVLRSAIAACASAQLAHPRVLLTTFPQEPHGMGLLMAEAMMALEGCCCISLGTQTPLWDIVLAATAHQVDVVALSFTASQHPNDVLRGLEELRSKLGVHTAIWAGGSCPIIHRRSIEGVTPVRALQDIAPLVAQWHQCATQS